VKVEILSNAEEMAQGAAAFLAAEARAAVRARGRFLLALSGGTTPLRMLELLVGADIPWSRVHLFQVDERVVAADDAARNLKGLRAALLDKISLPADQLHPLPVEAANLSDGAAEYATMLRQFAGTPPRLDLIHLGLGEDGHTASLVPGDPALQELQSEVAVTHPYQGYRRLTLTYPVLDRARCLLWLVTGPAKAPALLRLRRGDRSIPAGRVMSERAVLFADASAGALLS